MIMRQKLLIAWALALLLVPGALRAQDENPKPPAQIDRQKLREELRNLTPEERQAKLRELRQQGGPPGNTQGAGQRPLQGGMQAGGMGAGMGRVLMVLTPEQRESMRVAAEADREKTRDLEEKIREARKSALDATVESKFDENNLRKKLDAAAKLETDLTILRARALSKIEPPLSEEQIEQIKNAPVAGNLPQRRPNQQGRGPDAMPNEPLPFGNQPLPPPENNGPPAGNKPPAPGNP